MPSCREPVDVNTAPAELLRKSVPKVGAVLAQRIVEFREQNGPFKSADDLMSVPGIGRRLAESLMPLAEPGSSLIMDVRHRTLPPPWGTPDTTSGERLPGDGEDGTGEENGEGTSNAPEILSEAVVPSRRPRAATLKIASLAFAIVAGLCIGIWANTESVKRPTRELGERLDATRAEQDRTRTDLVHRSGEIRETQEAVKALSARVDNESAERKADQARITHDVSSLHDTVKRTSQSNEARIQRLRETLVEIELYHGANIAHPVARAH